MSKLFILRSKADEIEAIAEAANAIRAGWLVIFPTETVYGLAADALNPEAVARVFAAKHRNADHPLPVQIPDAESLHLVSDTPGNVALLLASRFWPGPLTLIVPRGHTIQDIVTAGQDTVGVRVPNHPIALALLRELGRPLVATSANLSGRAAPVTAHDAMIQIGDSVKVVIDAGPCMIGVASTIVDTMCNPPNILREGSITKQTIIQALTGGLGE